MPLDTELHKAAHKGDLRTVIDLVQSGEKAVDEPGAQNRTALHSEFEPEFRVSWRVATKVQISDCSQGSINPNPILFFNKRTLRVIKSAKKDRPPWISLYLILDSGSTPDVALDAGLFKTLQSEARAAGGNHVGIMHYLLEAGAPINSLDRWSRTPLHWAAISGNLDATQMLLEHGADVRCATVSGMTPLMAAAQHGFHEVVAALLDWVESSSRENETETSDIVAPTVVELCMAMDVNGKTALALAKEKRLRSMVKLLKSYMPKSKLRTPCGFAGKEQEFPAVVQPRTDCKRDVAADGGMDGASHSGRSREGGLGMGIEAGGGANSGGNPACKRPALRGWRWTLLLLCSQVASHRGRCCFRSESRSCFRNGLRDTAGPPC